MKTVAETLRDIDLETMMNIAIDAQKKRKEAQAKRKAKVYKWSDYFPATKGV